MHAQFASPFSWRYGSDEMRALWGEIHKRLLWRRIWVALARTQAQAGLIRPEQVADLEAHSVDVDIDRSLEIEAVIRHDLMAEVAAFAEQCPVGGGIIHLGATSADIEDNADALRLKASLDLLLERLRGLLAALADQIDHYANLPVMAFTHIQPAEPTTLGYRFALYGQDLLEDYQTLVQVARDLRGKGLKGAVGTAASYSELLDGTGWTAADLEASVMGALGIGAYPITSQTYPRKQDWRIVSALAGLAASLSKFAFDLRILQTPPLGEWGEPFGTRQVGSSAMPFKRNPIQAEKINSLARLVASLPQVTWENASHSLLERTLDDSANRREVLPVAFLAAEELVISATRIVSGLRVDVDAAQRNLERYGAFAAVERVLMAAVKAGADRQQMHEHLREHSMAAWGAIAAGGINPLVELLTSSPTLLSYLPEERLRALLDASAYTGDSAHRAAVFAAHIRSCFTLQS